MHIFTPEDLLQYLYHETSPSTTAAIHAALETDWALREELELLTSTQKKLDKIEVSPRKETIDNILNYAEKAISELQAH